MKEKYSVANVYRSMCYLCMRNKGVFYDMMEKMGEKSVCLPIILFCPLR
jgi:hypothetical protein